MLAKCILAYLVVTPMLATTDYPQKKESEKKPDDKKQPAVKPIEFKGSLSSSDPFDYRRTSSFHKVHTVELKGGVPYTIQVEGKSFMPYIRVEDFRGNMRTENRRFGGNVTVVDFLPPETEKYRIVVASLNARRTGQYTLSIQGKGKPFFAVKGVIARQDPFDNVRPKCHRKVHIVKMVPGKTYVIHCTTTVHDGYLRLEDSNNRQLAANDDWMDTRNSRIVFTPQKADNYRIIVTTFSPRATGPYQLTITER